MSNYFANFPKVLYKFGSNEQPVYFQKISKYVDIVDSLKDKVSAYIEYEIRDFERPDTLAHRLYGNSEYDWTFFVMNDRLREMGWPMTLQEVYDYSVNKAHTNYVIQLDVSTFDSAAEFAPIMTAGKQITLGGKQATIERQDLDNAQVYVACDSDVTQSTSMYVDSQFYMIKNTIYEYNAVHHYTNDSDQWVDYFSAEPFKTEVSNLDHLVQQNDETKRIRVIKKESIESVVSEFKRLIASR